MERKNVLTILLCGVLLLVLFTSCSEKGKLVPLPAIETQKVVPTEALKVVPTAGSGIALTPSPSAAEAATPIPGRAIYPSMVALKKELEEQLKPFGESVAITVTDLQTGETASVNGDLLFYPASTIKALVLLSVLKDVEAGRYPLNQVSEDLVAMMAYSDNAATDVLIDKTGFDRIVVIIERAGLTNTLFCHGFDFLAYACHTPNQMTANDANRLWQALYEGGVLAPSHRTLALGFAALPQDQCIFAPIGVLVAHKTGEADEYRSDSGLVLYFDNKGYAISFFSKGVTNACGLLWDHLGRDIYRWFTENYERISSGAK